MPNFELMARAEGMVATAGRALSGERNAHDAAKKLADNDEEMDELRKASSAFCWAPSGRIRSRPPSTWRCWVVTTSASPTTR